MLGRYALTLLFAATAISAADQQPLALPGVTIEERLAFLRNLDNQKGDGSRARRVVPIEERNRYWFAALSDGEAKIREWAAGASVVSDSHVPPLIRLLAHDADWTVREAAGLSISNWITANGAETCTAKTEVARNLDDLLLGLKSIATARSVVEVLGGRYSGDSPLACCMSMRDKKRIEQALVDMLGMTPGPPGYGSWGNYPQAALKNIDACPAR